MMLYDQAMQFTVNAKKIWVFYNKCWVTFLHTHTQHVEELHTDLMLNMLISSTGILCMLQYMNRQIRVRAVPVSS